MPDTPAPAAGLLRSLVACAGSAATAWGLGIAARHLTAAAVAPAAGVDDVVAAAVVTLGASAAVVLCFGCSLLVIGAAARLAGRTWRWCDATAARVTPAVVRRAVTVTVTTGLGLTAVAGTASATEIDLGWAPTDDRTTVSDAAERTVSSEAPQPSGSGAGDDARQVPDPTLPDEATERVPETTASGGSAVDLTAPTVARAGPDVREPIGSVHVPDPPTDASARPADARSAPSATPSSGTPADPVQVTVRSGDSLWTIARAHLDQPSDADIAVEWPRWYAANREVIGSDPDLIHPGQVLVVPTDEELQ